MLTVKNLSKFIVGPAAERTLFNNFSFDVHAGEFVGILGPNGVGKTTLFNMIAGLDDKYSGYISTVSLRAQKIGYVFQNYRQSLFPWLNIFDNISYPLKIAGKSLTERKKIIASLCNEFEIFFDLAKYPYELSGGQQQMVAVLRALVYEPSLLLLDEPFSAIDHDSTTVLMRLIAMVWEKTRITILLISHDVDEALLLCQRILVFRGSPVAVVRDITHEEPYPRSTEAQGSVRFAVLKKSILDSFVYES